MKIYDICLLLEDRIEHMYSMFKKRVGDKEKELGDTDALNAIIKADPSTSKNYTPWLVKLYLSGNLKLEDLYKATEYLAIFDKVKQKLEVKDINRFKTLPDLYDVVKPFTEYKSNREIDSAQRDDIRKSIQVIYKGPEGKLMIPLTKEASCYLGRNTQWCTAATTSENKFDDYNEEGRLIVVILPNKKKYQFHTTTCEFMDENDRNVDIESFESEHELLFSKMVPFINISKKRRVEIIYSHPYMIKFMGELSREERLIALGVKPSLIGVIDNPTPEEQLYAVKRDGNNIRFIKNPSVEVAVAAFRKNSGSYSLIKEPSREIQLAIVKVNPYFVDRMFKTNSYGSYGKDGGVHQDVIDYIKQHHTEVVDHLIEIGSPKARFFTKENK